MYTLLLLLLRYAIKTFMVLICPQPKSWLPRKNVEEIRLFIGADELIYQDIEDLRMAAHIGNTNITSFEDSVLRASIVPGNF